MIFLFTKHPLCILCVAYLQAAVCELFPKVALKQLKIQTGPFCALWYCPLLPKNWNKKNREIMRIHNWPCEYRASSFCPIIDALKVTNFLLAEPRYSKLSNKVTQRVPSFVSASSCFSVTHNSRQALYPTLPNGE